MKVMLKPNCVTGTKAAHPCGSSNGRCAFLSWAGTRGLPLAICDRMASAWRMNSYKKGDMLFYQGNEPQSLFFLCEGAVKLVRADRMGRQHILRVIAVADFLGDRALLAGQPYAASAEVMEDAQICALDAGKFREFWRTEPDLPRLFARYLALKLADADEASTDLALCTIGEMLAKMILRRSQEARGGIFTFFESRQELADILGTSPEVVSRTLAEFRLKGLLKIEGRRVKILNEARLRAVARVPVNEPNLYQARG